MVAKNTKAAGSGPTSCGPDAATTEIRVGVQFTPVAIPLFPGQPLPDLAWSELRYDAYCFVLPDPLHP